MKHPVHKIKLEPTDLKHYNIFLTAEQLQSLFENIKHLYTGSDEYIPIDFVVRVVNQMNNKALRDLEKRGN